MPGLRPTTGNLTSAEIRQAIFLTLAFVLILLSRLCHADTYTPEEKQRIGDIENYIRKESLQGVSLLPSEARSAIGWFSGGWHAMPLSNLTASLTGDDDGDAPAATPQAMADQSETSDGGVPLHLAGNFHHKGFLPTHDAMVMGIGVSRNVVEDKLQVTAHPFYGQSWGALQGYWGGEMSLDIAQHADGLPWGKIALGYVGGNETLTDHGRGMDLHGDIDLTENWKFTSGLRQNSVDGGSNYVMLRWKMGFD